MHCTKDKRPKGSFGGEGKRHNKVVSGNIRKLNASISGEKKSSNSLFVCKSKRPNVLSVREHKYGCDVENGCKEHLPHQEKGTRLVALSQGEQEAGLMFKNRQGKLSGQMSLNIKTEKGNNVEQGAGTKSWMVTTVMEEVSRWLCEMDNACEQMAFKISHVEVGS